MLTVTLTLPELPLTAEQFGELPDPEGFRLELADGENSRDGSRSDDLALERFSPHQESSGQTGQGDRS